MTTEKTDRDIAVEEASLNSCIQQLSDLDVRVKEEKDRIYSQAREAGLDPKAVRKVYARLRRDPEELAKADKQQMLYEAALDDKTRQVMALAREGRSAREIEEITGMSKSAINRAVPTNGNGWDSKQTQTSDQPAASTEIEDDLTPPAHLDRRPSPSAPAGSLAAVGTQDRQ